jgi:hypothetical protein
VQNEIGHGRLGRGIEIIGPQLTLRSWAARDGTRFKTPSEGAETTTRSPPLREVSGAACNQCVINLSR